MNITFIVPTIGRPSLMKTLESIETLSGDEILIVGNIVDLDVQRPEVIFIYCEPGNDWGHKERNYATPFARCPYIAHIDDDDFYAFGSRALMADAIVKHSDQPTIFRMRYPNGITLWQEPAIRCGNVGTPMFLMPNRPEMFGTWGSFVGGDCHFLETSKWKPEDYVWRPEVIALLGHN